MDHEAWCGGRSKRGDGTAATAPTETPRPPQNVGLSAFFISQHEQAQPTTTGQA